MALVFISHIEQEKEIAIALKSLIEDSFLDAVSVFVSSHPSSIPMGATWFEKVSDGLRDCDVQIIIASPSSIQRPWVSFEAGAVWFKKNPLIPLLHSGLTFDKLPDYLRGQQGGDSKNPTKLKELFEVIAAKARMRSPSTDFDGFINVVLEYEAVSRESASLNAQPMKRPGGVPLHEFTVLNLLANNARINDSLPVEELITMGEKSGVTRAGMSIGIKMLERKNLVKVLEVTEFGSATYLAVQLTDEGWTWLDQNRDLIKLHNDRDIDDDEDGEFAIASSEF